MKLEQRLLYLLPFLCMNLVNVHAAPSPNANIVQEQVHVSTDGQGNYNITWLTVSEPTGQLRLLMGEDQGSIGNITQPAVSTWFVTSYIMCMHTRYVHHATVSLPDGKTYGR